MKNDVTPSHPTLHFSAPTAHGSVRLELPSRHGDDAVAAALALADAEPLLQALESWLGTALDPTPHLEGPVPVGAGLVWCSAAGDARVGLPWPWLAQATPCGVAGLHLPALTLRVDVARWATLPPRPPSAASSTGLLLLPAAFDGAWRVTLVEPALGFEVDALWAGPGTAPRLAGAPRAAAPPAAAVRLLQTLQWPLAALMGWRQPPDTPLGDAAQAGSPGAACAAFGGRIVPALGGFALLVDAPVQEPAHEVVREAVQQPLHEPLQQVPSPLEPAPVAA